MTIINCDYIVITCSCRFPRFSHGSWITFWPFGSPTEPINPHTCKRKLLGDLKRLRLSPEKKTKTNIILICQLIHHDPCFTMIFQGVSGCFASIGLVNRCNALVPELGAWILCHPTSTTWQTGQICVCVCVAKKKVHHAKMLKNIEHYWILYTIVIIILYIIDYWQWLRVPVCQIVYRVC